MTIMDSSLPTRRSGMNSFSRSLVKKQAQDCVPADPQNTSADRITQLLQSGGPGYVLKLCPSTEYLLQSPVLFSAPNQEISTAGLPTDNTRATLVVNSPVFNGTGHTVAVDGTCSDCDGVILRNIQINGTRGTGGITAGGANIEFGGDNQNQLIEHVHSFDPRGWSCMHLAEGPFTCANLIIQNNDIGPCGSDDFQEWADGISMACKDSVIRGNMINNPTDGGIVLFGARGTLVENNTIWVETRTLLGGINMVDYAPWSGDMTGVIVRNNIIRGGFATDVADEDSQSRGENNETAIIKIGIAIGPRTWFGDRYSDNTTFGGSVIDNEFSGAFSYAMGIGGARNFNVQGNKLVGNTTFIGSRGPNCTTSDITPTPAAFVQDQNRVQSSTIQSDFQTIADADALTCVLPPAGGDFWPFGGGAETGVGGNGGNGGNTGGNQAGDESSSGGPNKVGLAVGIVVGVLAVGVAAWFIRRWASRRGEKTQIYKTSRAGYVQSKEQM